MADSTDDEEYEYDEQASVSEDYPDESEDEQSEGVEDEEEEPTPPRWRHPSGWTSPS